jgi:hypothetical protein
VIQLQCPKKTREYGSCWSSPWSDGAVTDFCSDIFMEEPGAIQWWTQRLSSLLLTQFGNPL